MFMPICFTPICRRGVLSARAAAAPDDFWKMVPMRDYCRFDGFIEALVGDVYPEVPMEPHVTITRTTIEALHRDGLIAPGARVLDVGCGQGLALEQFRALGLDTVGITLGSDAEICRRKGFDVREMDQNFMDFADGSFDLLWCRHVLEHSVAPLFTLSEYRRVTKPGGLVYVEVPAPDTSAHHERNPNHYSVLPMSSWLNLIARAGFAVARNNQLSFKVPCGPDMYWSFLLRRPA
jgi:SAM-dependent methyltransferase